MKRKELQLHTAKMTWMDASQKHNVEQNKQKYSFCTIPFTQFKIRKNQINLRDVYIGGKS